MSEDQSGFDYFQCGECDFDSVQLSTFAGSRECPLCAGDSGHSNVMTRRTARTTDNPEGYDARAASKGSASSRSTGEA